MSGSTVAELLKEYPMATANSFQNGYDVFVCLKEDAASDSLHPEETIERFAFQSGPIRNQFSPELFVQQRKVNKFSPLVRKDSGRYSVKVVKQIVHPRNKWVSGNRYDLLRECRYLFDFSAR
jgi:hypothetical protein